MKYILSVLLLSLLSACAQKQIVIREEGLRPLRQYVTQVVYVTGNPKLSVASIEDVTPQNFTIGSAFTGAVNTNTLVTTDVPVADFLKSRISRGLEMRGFDVQGETPYVLKGRIQQLTVAELKETAVKESAQCNYVLNYEIVERKTDKVVVNGTLTSEVIGANSPVDATGSLGPAIETCISLSLNNFVKDNRVSQLLKFQVKQ